LPAESYLSSSLPPWAECWRRARHGGFLWDASAEQRSSSIAVSTSSLSLYATASRKSGEPAASDRQADPVRRTAEPCRATGASRRAGGSAVRADVLSINAILGVGTSGAALLKGNITDSSQFLMQASRLRPSASARRFWHHLRAGLLSGHGLRAVPPHHDDADGVALLRDNRRRPGDQPLAASPYAAGALGVIAAVAVHAVWREPAALVSWRRHRGFERRSQSWGCIRSSSASQVSGLSWRHRCIVEGIEAIVATVGLLAIGMAHC